MSVSRCRSVLICVSIALAACSGNTNAQSAHAQQVQATTHPAASAVPTAPAVESTIRALPDFSPLVEKYGPAVVNVEVVEKAQPQADRRACRRTIRSTISSAVSASPRLIRAARQPPPVRGAGSGFIVSPDGYILTNAHVVANADEVTVRLTDRREFPAKVVGADERTDVAVIKIDASNLPTVKLGDPAKIEPGEWVLAIGSPFGFENSVTAGIVSATLALAAGRQLRAVHPDRRGGEPRQLRRSAVQPAAAK